MFVLFFSYIEILNFLDGIILLFYMLLFILYTKSCFNCVVVIVVVVGFLLHTCKSFIPCMKVFKSNFY